MGSAFTYLYLASFTAQVAVAALISVTLPQRVLRRSLLALMGAAALWSLADFLGAAAPTAELMRTLTHVFVFAWAPVPYLALRAAFVYADNRRMLRSIAWNTLLLLPAAGCVVLVLDDRLMIDLVPSGSDKIEHGDQQQHQQQSQQANQQRRGRRRG